MTTESAILTAFVKGLQVKLGWTPEQIYSVAAPAHIDGMNPDVLQISMGAISPYGGGDGYQDGGSVQKRGNVCVTYFKKIFMDAHGHATEALTREGEGLMEVRSRICAALAMTVLGGWVLEPVKWAGESMTTWEDPENGLLRRDINFSVVWAEELPLTVTLTTTDLQ